MKRLLLSTGFTIAALAAQAQIGPLVQLISIGANPKLRNNLMNNVLADEPYVPQATRHLQLKRTPADKLPKKGGAAVTELEALLQQCYTTYAADSLTEILGPDQYRAFSEGRRKAQTLPGAWNIRPYDEEMAFYQQQDHIRRARRARVARQPQAPGAAR